MNKGIRKAASILTLITIVCKLFGFIKNVVLAKYWGTSPAVDAYAMVFAVGNIVFGWIGGFTGNFTPEYKRVQIEHGKNKADEYAYNLRSWLVIITVISIVFFEVFAKQIIHFVAPGFTGEVYDTTVDFWRIYSLGFVALVLYRLYKEYINCNEKYVLAVLPDLLTSSLCIVAIIISRYLGKEWLIIGYVFATVCEAIVERVISYKLGFHNKWRLKLDESMKNVFRAVLPVFLSDTLIEINSFVDKFFASNLEQGTMAVLDYANTVKNIAYETGIVAVITIMYPKMAELWAKKDTESFGKDFLKNVRLMCIVFIPISLAFIVAGDYLVAYIYQRGAFTEDSTIKTAGALTMYSVGLVAVVIRLVLNKCFCAMQKTRYVFITSIVNVVINIIVNFILVKKMGMKGLALATSMAAIAAMVVGFVILARILKLKWGSTIVAIIKVVIAGAVMYGLVWGARKLFLDNIQIGFFTDIVRLAFSFFIGVLGYIGVILLLRLEEVAEVLQILKKKRR